MSLNRPPSLRQTLDVLYHDMERLAMLPVNLRSINTNTCFGLFVNHLSISQFKDFLNACHVEAV